MPAKKTKRWVAKVKTDSTHPPEGLFTKSAATIARTLASKKVSPKGPASGMRMLNYFINRGGRALSASCRAELEKAKALLSRRIRPQKRESVLHEVLQIPPVRAWHSSASSPCLTPWK